MKKDKWSGWEKPSITTWFDCKPSWRKESQDKIVRQS